MKRVIVHRAEDKPASTKDAVNLVYLPSGRCVGFVRGSRAVAEAVVKDMLEKNSHIPWRERGYVIRRMPDQKAPNAKRRRR